MNSHNCIHLVFCLCTRYTTKTLRQTELSREEFGRFMQVLVNKSKAARVVEPEPEPEPVLVDTHANPVYL